MQISTLRVFHQYTPSCPGHTEEHNIQANIITVGGRQRPQYYANNSLYKTLYIKNT